MISAPTVKLFTGCPERIGNVAIELLARVNTWLYRVSSGKLWGCWLAGAPILLLTTIGRRWAKLRTTLLLYLRDGVTLVIVGSKGGMSHPPLWYRSLQAHSEVEIQIGKEERPMRARRAMEEEQAALWPKLVAMYTDFAVYQARTTRDTTVVSLSPP